MFKENDAYFYSQKLDDGTIIDRINGTFLTDPYDFAFMKPTRQYLDDEERRVAIEGNFEIFTNRWFYV